MEGTNLELGSYVVSLSDKLGQGAYGVVYQGQQGRTGHKVAVKQCQIQSDQTGAVAMKEIKNLQQIERHPNIVHLLDFQYQKSSIWIIMEYCDVGDLVHYMKTKLPELPEKLKIMQQCASAIAFMHSREYPIVHRDIKPPNIMMKTEGPDTVVKITDFGISKIAEELPNPGMPAMYSTHVGTPAYMAPEFFLGQKYTTSVDVFALGLVYLALLNYDPGKPEMIPLSANSKKHGMLIPIGAEMAQLGKMDMPLPELMEDSAEDSAMVRTLKDIIRKMAAYDSKARLPMREVEQELDKLSVSVEACALHPVNEPPLRKECATDVTALLPLKEALDNVSIDSGIGSSFNMLLTEVLGDSNPIMEVPKLGNFSETVLKVELFDRMLQVEDKRYSLHHSFQTIMDRGENLSKTLAEAYCQLCSTRHRDRDKAIQLGYRLGDFLNEAGWFYDAEKVYLSSLEICKDMNTNEYFQQSLDLYIRLLHVRTASCQFCEAQQAWDKTKGILDKMESNNQPVNKSLLYSEYSALLSQQGLCDKAYQQCQRSLQELDSTLPPAEVVVILGHCVQACGRKNKLKKAELLSTFLVSYVRNKFGDEDLKYSAALESYGFILGKMDLLDLSIQAHRESLNIKTKVFGKNNFHVAMANVYLSYIQYMNTVRTMEYDTTRYFTKAQSHADCALSIMNSILPSDHFLLSKAQIYKGLILMAIASDCEDTTKKLHLLQEALDLQLSSLNIIVKTLGESNLEMTEIYHSLGKTYRKMDRLQEAEAVYKKAICVTETLCGTEHLAMFTALEDLAGLYNYYMKRYKEAEELYLQCVSIGQKTDPAYSELQYVYYSLVHIYHETGNRPKEEEYSTALDQWGKLQSQVNTRRKKIQSLIDFYHVTGNTEKEEQFSKELASWEKRQGQGQEKQPIERERFETVEQVVQQFFKID